MVVFFVDKTFPSAVPWDFVGAGLVHVDTVSGTGLATNVARKKANGLKLVGCKSVSAMVILKVLEQADVSFPAHWAAL